MSSYKNSGSSVHIAQNTLEIHGNLEANSTSDLDCQFFDLQDLSLGGNEYVWTEVFLLLSLS